MKTIYELKNGHFVLVNKPSTPSRPIFAVVWDNGAATTAWSSWQSLQAIKKMFPVLERSKSSGYFVVQKEKEDSELL